MPDASLSILLLLPPPSLTTHPVRGFKDYFYFGTKKICLATRRRAHVPRSTKKTTRRRTNVSVSFSFRPRSSSSWEFIASLSLLPARYPCRASFSCDPSRKTDGKRGTRRNEDKSERVPKAAARRVGISVTRDGQEVGWNRTAGFLSASCT